MPFYCWPNLQRWMDGWLHGSLFLAGWNRKFKLNSFKDTFVAVFRLDLVYLLKPKWNLNNSAGTLKNKHRYFLIKMNPQVVHAMQLRSSTRHYLGCTWSSWANSWDFLLQLMFWGGHILHYRNIQSTYFHNDIRISCHRISSHCVTHVKILKGIKGLESSRSCTSKNWRFSSGSP